MHPNDWVALARDLHASLGEYDGIVVVHGNRHEGLHASALGLLLGPLPKPVVLTGSQRPLAEARTDARENLVDAAIVGDARRTEVCVTFGRVVLRGRAVDVARCVGARRVRLAELRAHP